jgi:peptide methionine sulfoxide reductase MsrB
MTSDKWAEVREAVKKEFGVDDHIFADSNKPGDISCPVCDLDLYANPAHFDAKAGTSGLYRFCPSPVALCAKCGHNKLGNMFNDPPQAGEECRCIQLVRQQFCGCECVFPATDKASVSAPASMPLCPPHQGLENNGHLELRYDGNCLACSLNERAELLDILATGHGTGPIHTTSTGMLRELVYERRDLKLLLKDVLKAAQGTAGYIGQDGQIHKRIRMAIEGITEEDIYETRQNGAGLGD